MKHIIKTILLASVIAIMLPTIMQADQILGPQVPAKVRYQLLANEISARYEVKASVVKKIIKCESNWNPNAVNSNSREYSVGLSQINLKAHRDITAVQARNPEFAIDYLASNIADGNASMWSCAR